MVFISYLILGCVYVLHYVEIDLSFSVEELPVKMEAPGMTPTSKGDNVIVTYEHSIYTLSNSGSKYSWTKMPHRLSHERKFHVQVLVPASSIQC